MLPRFLEHVRSKGLIDAAKPTLVGYSGGPDSTCLLHLMHVGGFDVIAAHLHHGQREEADKEMSLCEAFCNELGVPFLSGRADVPRIAASLKVGLEEAGRMARYDFFDSAANATEVGAIATAHTRDDQVETVLLNLVRGTGLTGLAGIPERRGRIVRPLLPFSRSETQAYCKEHGLWTHDDPANTDLSFSRARVRHEVSPALRHINEDYAEAILRLSEIAKSEDEFLNGMAAAALEKSEISLNGELNFLTRDNEITFNRDLLLHLPSVLLKRALRLATLAVGGALDHNQTTIAELGCRTGRPGSITCEGGDVRIEWSANEVTARLTKPTPPFRSNLTVPGETISDEMNWALTAEYAPMPRGSLPRASLEAYLAATTTKGLLYFRNWKPGDEMRPLGFSGRRKLADLMSEASLTANAKARLPLVCDMLGPLWAPGVCVDERCRAEEGSKVLSLSFRALV